MNALVRQPSDKKRGREYRTGGRLSCTWSPMVMTIYENVFIFIQTRTSDQVFHHGAYSEWVPLGRLLGLRRNPGHITGYWGLPRMRWWRPEIHGRVPHGWPELEDTSGCTKPPGEFHFRRRNSGNSSGDVCTRHTVQVRAELPRVTWIFLGAPLKVNGAPGNIQGNLTVP